MEFLLYFAQREHVHTFFHPSVCPHIDSHQIPFPGEEGDDSFGGETGSANSANFTELDSVRVERIHHGLKYGDVQIEAGQTTNSVIEGGNDRILDERNHFVFCVCIFLSEEGKEVRESNLLAQNIISVIIIEFQGVLNLYKIRKLCEGRMPDAHPNACNRNCVFGLRL